MWSGHKKSVAVLWWVALWTATCPRCLADVPLPTPNESMSELQLLFPKMCKPVPDLEQQLAALISGRDIVDPCVQSCLSYSFGEDRGPLDGLAYYYQEKHGKHELRAPLKSLCPGTVKEHGKTLVSETSTPKKSINHTSILSNDMYEVGLPEGWGDDEVHTWWIGRPLKDFTTIKMDRGYSTYRNPRYEERRVIHPKKHMHLRFPSLSSGTFSQKINRYEYARPYIRVSVQACECLTQEGCESYQSIRSPGLSQCTALGSVETMPSGGFKVSCEALPEIDGRPQPTGCSFTGDGHDVVFTARDDGFKIVVETPKTFASEDPKERQTPSAIKDLAVVARENCTYELANAQKATACALETMSLIDFTRLQGNPPACCVKWEMRHAGAGAINSGSAIVDGEYLTLAYYPTPSIKRPRFKWTGVGEGQEVHFCNSETGQPTWKTDEFRKATSESYVLGIKFKAKCNIYGAVSVGNYFHVPSANPEGGWSTTFFNEWIAGDGVPSRKAVQIEAGLKNISDAVPVRRIHTKDGTGVGAYSVSIPSDFSPGIVQPAKGYIIVEYKACGPAYEDRLQGPECSPQTTESENSTNSTNATLGSTEPPNQEENEDKCQDPCCPCNVTMVKRLAHVVPGGFECSAPASSSMHRCTTHRDDVQITFYSDFGWEVVAVRFVYEMPVPPFGIGIAIDDVAMASCDVDKCKHKKLLTGSIELKYFTVEVVDGRDSANEPTLPQTTPSPPPPISQYCQEGLLGLVGRPCAEWDAADAQPTCPHYLQRLNNCIFGECCDTVAHKISESLADASSVSDCRRSDEQDWHVASESEPPVCVPPAPSPALPAPSTRISPTSPPPQPTPPPLILMPPTGAPSEPGVGGAGGSGQNGDDSTGQSEKCTPDLCVTLIVALPISMDDFSSEKRRTFREAIATAAGIKVEAVEISSVEAATVWRRRLLQDAVHVAVEVSSTDDGGRTEHKCPCSAAGQAAHCHGWSHGYNALSDQRSIRQIITDNPQQAAAVAESLTEENMNKQLKAQGLPEAKVIQGAQVATSLGSSGPVNMTAVIIGAAVGGACLLLVTAALWSRRCGVRDGEDDSKVDDSVFHPVAASPDRQITVQSNKPESRDLPTWLEDSPSAVKGAVVGSLEHDSDDDEQEGKWAQDAKAVVDENGFKEKTLVDASPGEEEKENAVNGRKRRAGRRRARFSNSEGIVAGTYAANARKSSSAGWGEIVPFPDDEFDAETASSHVAVSIAANEGQEGGKANLPDSPSHVIAIETSNTLTTDITSSP